MPADDPTFDPTEEPTDEEAARIAYELAEERIAQAKAEGWRYLNLSGTTQVVEDYGERRSGDKTLMGLDALPPNLAGLDILLRLDLDRTVVANLARLSEMTSLRYLNLDFTEVVDVSPLAQMKELNKLGISYTRVADLQSIAELTSLQYLGVIKTHVVDFTPLAKMTWLEDLYANGTQITDLEPLAGMTAMQRLHLDGTQVADLRPVAGMTALEEFYFRGIPACDAEPELKALSEIDDTRERTQKTLDWLRARYRGADSDKRPAPSDPEQEAMAEAQQTAKVSLRVTPRHAESDFEVPEGGTDLVETPLTGDVPDIDDPYRMRQQADRLSTLSDLARELFNDIKTDQPNVPDALRRDLKRYGDEMGKPPDQLRPQYLRSRMKVFVIAQGDENIRMGLGDYALAKFEDLIEEHNAVMAAFYGAQIERMRQSDEDPLLDAATPEALEDVIKDAIDLTTGEDWEHYPGLPQELTEEMRERLALSRETRGKLDMKPDEAQAAGKDQLARDNRVMAATAGQAVGRAVEWVAKDPKVRATANLGSATGFLQALGRLLGF